MGKAKKGSAGGGKSDTKETKKARLVGPRTHLLLQSLTVPRVGREESQTNQQRGKEGQDEDDQDRRRHRF